VKHCLLVAEDNALNRELLCDWLAVEGFESLSASDLKSSFDALSKNSFAAVLLDINLGNEDGLAIVEWMRQRPEFRDIPVIAVTAHALATEQERILQAGCNACLSKPIDFKALRKQLDYWL
jgi:CheY-like chemotaxis protein